MADTIKILVATDNHVGAHERDPIRGDDSWKTFHEIMCLAKDRDVDMVLLAGDLFHDNKPSRKSMYNVMRSLRLNCLSDKPCELEMLSDESEHFDATFDHVNYEDANINVGIPVFSIHGNHDDPTGDGHYAALDLLAVSGLVNYYGKTPQSDNIVVKPVLIQKGQTKLALYGISNVRDERLHRTFKSQRVKFHRPSTQMEDWYNVICVHQNHHAYTETSYLPESFLPDFLDLVIWGHEHECLIEPRLNPEMNFHVMQPGSSVATSLIPGEAVPKHVAIVTITGREMKSEPIRLKTVRPFVYKDIVLSDDKGAVRIAKKKDDHRAELTRRLIEIVDEMIEQAKAEWREAQEERQDDVDAPEECPLPLIRLRVETTSPDGGVTKFDVENPQRFSNRFIERVANINDVVQFHVKKKNAATRAARDAEADRQFMAKFQGIESIKVDKLVREFLQAQSLTILPQNYFGDAVSQYVEKDDKHAMEMFVNESLADQIKSLVQLQTDANDDGEDDEDLAYLINEQRAKMEELFAKGIIKASANKARFKPKPDDWNSDWDGHWEDQPGALIRASEDLYDDEDEDEDDGTPVPRTTTAGRGGGRGRGGRGASTAITSTRKKTTTTPAAAKKPAATASRGRKRAVPDDEEDEEDEDIVTLDNEGEDDDSQAMFFPEKRKPTTTRSSTRGRNTTPAFSSTTQGRTAGATKKPPTRAAVTRASKQSTLNFTTSQNSILGNGRSQSYDVEEDDDDEAFEPAPSTSRRR
ncbi:DNA repair protein (mre11) [Rhinocladiella mackenziei CBS 650.93]|uniref:Double-strand break repair protein n=1 Tax=Rhinocladiella mackenziei CBS 650.93 TaxID=1442369 RepID=A0A0D2GNW8_9EURO|nr:DNA repair protein (mre11) [Rhinocladiella mackenziei CBS 650.93]KIX00013.1 DNA repair protein (mre11) [Rhinocladiella mackenziei CBS 650.93]